MTGYNPSITNAAAQRRSNTMPVFWVCGITGDTTRTEGELGQVQNGRIFVIATVQIQ